MKDLLYWNIVALIVGAVMDAIVGDPENRLHMVVIFGTVIKVLEDRFYKHRYHRRAYGTLLVILCVTLTALVLGVLLFALWKLHHLLYCLWASVLCWQCLAAKSLRDASEKVRVPLEAGDLDQARQMVGRIVGRDTKILDEAGVARAAVETVAENTSDGVIAPLFYLALGGPVLGCVYKMINTMDSMLGYKNARYIDFGRAAAKLDDAVNYLPSRLAALLLILAAKIQKLDAKNAARIWKRDRRNHASPNSAQTESVVAGALGLRLAGPTSYFGQPKEDKPYIGDALREIEPEDIRRANRLMFTAAAEMTVLALVCMYAVYLAI